VFLNSHYCYRPLWTSVAQRRGCAIDLLFYSANTESIRFEGFEPVSIPGYRGMRWPHHLVWDQAQADFVRSVCDPAARVTVVGPVSMSDHDAPLPSFAPPTIAVFDVPVQTDESMATKGIAGTYYSPEHVAAFLTDVSACARELGINVVLKGKRDLGTNVHPQYKRAHACAMEAGMVALDERIAAGRLIGAVDGVLSIPFTSPAIVGRDRGIPSAYYDPSSTIVRPQRADHGVPTLHQRAELKAWMERLLQRAHASR
jgi:polysaccharide biosynthesis PFTS motif protein